MNRRRFLSMAGAAACVSTGGLGISRKLFAQTIISPTILNNSVDAHAVFTANAYDGFATPQALKHLANVQENVYAHFLNIGLDDQIKSAMIGVNPSTINLASIDLTQYVAAVQQYEPTFNILAAQELVSAYQNDSAMFASAVWGLQQSGLSPYVMQTSVGYGLLAQAFTAPDGGISSVRSPWKGRPNLAIRRTADGTKSSNYADYIPAENKPHLLRVQNWGRPMPQPLSPPPQSGGGGYNCQTDALAGLGYTLALATIGVMCYITVIGAPICTAAFLTYAGAAGAGWSLGHAIKCGL